MRAELAKREGLRGRWRATVECFRTRTSAGHEVRMILLKAVVDETGAEVTDHVHFTLAKCWEGIQPGDVVAFDARVATYWKGYHDDRRKDYRLSHPTHVSVVDRVAAKHEGPQLVFEWPE